MFLVAVGFWNFLGAGIFGFLINLPIVSYYEIGTALTANHGHAAMMGVYGMLAIGLALFCLRYLIPADRWPEKWARICFWSTNIGLAWMCFATLLPLGILQLYESVNDGYCEARELKFLTNDTNALLEWLRLPGDIVFIAGGAHPGALHRLPRHPPHGQAGHARGARGHPVHRDRASPRACRRWATTRPRRRGSRERRGRAGRRLRGVAARVGAFGARVAVGAHAPALAALPHGRLRPTTRSTTTGSCPEGQHLWPHEFDHERRLVRYRAKAHICNGCPRKERLHRLRPRARDRPAARPVAALGGRALPPRALARCWSRSPCSCWSSAGVRNHEPAEAALLLALLLVAALLAGRWLLRDLRAHPANFPEPTAAHGLRWRSPAPTADARAAAGRRRTERRIRR